eukprot:1158169-Pelagomonas_calceolata.AAC.6
MGPLCHSVGHGAFGQALPARGGCTAEQDLNYYYLKQTGALAVCSIVCVFGPALPARGCAGSVMGSMT